MRMLECCVTMLRWYCYFWMPGRKEPVNMYCDSGRPSCSTSVLKTKQNMLTRHWGCSFRLPLSHHNYLSHQLTWGQFINTHRGKCHNLPSTSISSSQRYHWKRGCQFRHHLCSKVCIVSWENIDWLWQAYFHPPWGNSTQQEVQWEWCQGSCRCGS